MSAQSGARDARGDGGADRTALQCAVRIPAWEARGGQGDTAMRSQGHGEGPGELSGGAGRKALTGQRSGVRAAVVGTPLMRLVCDNRLGVRCR